MTASDKLFFWLFQNQPDRILQLLPDLPADAGGYRFVAPVFKALEHRPDGMFLAAQQGPPLLRTLALLLEREERLPLTTAQIRSAVAGTELESQIADATAAILLARFTTRPIPEICAMGGITLEDFTQSVAYKEIFGLGEQRGREQGLKTGELEITLRQLRRRCGGLTPSQEARIRALPLPQLEALAEALLDFKGADDLEAWLATS
jgi:predicted transposase YdaD